MLSNDTRQFLSGALSKMVSPARVVFFTQTVGCESCAAAGRLLRDIASLSGHITIEERNHETVEILGALPEGDFVREVLSGQVASSQ